MVKIGRLKLEPAKQMEKKSAMNQKLLGPLPPLPPIKTVNKPDDNKAKSAKKVQAYQVVFDDDQIKTKKYSKFSGIQKRDIRLHSEKIDNR